MPSNTLGLLGLINQYPRYEYWKSALSGKWYWHYKAANHEIVAQSEGYSSKENCLHAIKLMQESAGRPVQQI